MGGHAHVCTDGDRYAAVDTAAGGRTGQLSVTGAQVPVGWSCPLTYLQPQ